MGEDRGRERHWTKTVELFLFAKKTTTRTVGKIAHGRARHCFMMMKRIAGTNLHAERLFGFAADFFFRPGSYLHVCGALLAAVCPAIYYYDRRFFSIYLCCCSDSLHLRFLSWWKQYSKLGSICCSRGFLGGLMPGGFRRI